MKFVIWTLAILWLIYRLSSLFKRADRGYRGASGARTPCRNANCPHTILPETAARTGGLCMPCFQGRAPGSVASTQRVDTPRDTIEYETSDSKPGAFNQKLGEAKAIEPRPLPRLDTSQEAPPPAPVSPWPQVLDEAPSLAALCVRTDSAGDAARRLLPFLLQPEGHTVSCLHRPESGLCIPLLVAGPSKMVAYHAYAGEWTPEAEQIFRTWIHAVKSCSATSTADIRIATDDLPSSLAVRASQA